LCIFVVRENDKLNNTQSIRTMITRLLLSAAVLFIGVQFASAQQVSKGIHQLMTVEEDNPKSLYIRLSTPNVKVKRTAGSRVRVSGKVSISIPNMYFLDHLVENGRYSLALTPTGDGGLKLEDHSRTPIILRGEQCTEEVHYKIYIPRSIESVVFENTVTGDSNVIVMK